MDNNVEPLKKMLTLFLRSLPETVKFNISRLHSYFFLTFQSVLEARLILYLIVVSLMIRSISQKLTLTLQILGNALP
jgi:hypothetical protein